MEDPASADARRLAAAIQAGVDHARWDDVVKPALEELLNEHSGVVLGADMDGKRALTFAADGVATTLLDVVENAPREGDLQELALTTLRNLARADRNVKRMYETPGVTRLALKCVQEGHSTVAQERALGLLANLAF